MFAYCSECGYDTGDRDTRKEVLRKLKEDGGRVEAVGDENAEGPTIVRRFCPNGHNQIRID